MLNIEKKDLKLNLHYSVLHAGFWSALAAETIFAVALLRQRGFSDGQIGIILAAKYFSAVLSQILISMLADKYSSRLTLKTIVGVFCVISFFTTALFYFRHPGFLGTVAVFSVFGATINGASPYLNAMAPRFREQGRKIYYSFARGVGSFSWGIAGLVLSLCVTNFQVESVLLVQLAFIAALFLTAVSMERTPHSGAPAQAQVSGAHSYWHLFRHHPRYLLFLIASVLLFISYTLETTFILDIVSAVGGGSMELGYIQLAQSLCELPPVFLFIALQKRLNVRRLIGISAVFAFLHTLATCLSQDFSGLLLAQLPQMLGIGIFWASSVEYVCLEIPRQDWVKGQALVNTCTLGISGIIGSVISGDIMGRLGIGALMLGATAISAVGVVLMLIAMRGAGTGALADRAAAGGGHTKR